jgi:hypothetical protein
MLLRSGGEVTWAHLALRQENAGKPEFPSAAFGRAPVGRTESLVCVKALQLNPY